jgi:cell division septal protein FtsQ
LRSRNKKKKSAYRRGEKLILFLKRGTIVFLAIAIVASAVYAVRILLQSFYVRNIELYGNYHLDREDIVGSLNIKKGTPMLDLKLNLLDEKLEENAWIKRAAIRRLLPGTLVIRIDESVPKALLSYRKSFFLIDEGGRILEKIKGEGTPFLPVIKNIEPKKKKELIEALKLIDALSAKNMLSNRDNVEIGLESYGLRLNLDSELIKVGFGRYAEKFERWLELEPEIRRRGVPLMYVDLRFKDSVIIKPLKKDEEGRTS